MYVTKLDVKQDSVRFELLTAGTAPLRYRAEVQFTVPGLSAMEPGQVKEIIDAALATAAVAEPGTTEPRAPAPNVVIHRSTTRPGVAPITPEQEQRIADQLKRAPASVAKQVGEATDTLKPFIALDSCINDYAGRSHLQTYLGPHGDLNAIASPYAVLHYHDKGSCLDVTRIQGWTGLSLNAVQFQVVCTAADSGESAARTHVMQREPDGTWLMNN